MNVQNCNNITCPYFFRSDKVSQTLIQSDNSIEIYRLYDLLLQTDTFVKTIFSDSGGLKTQRFALRKKI